MIINLWLFTTYIGSLRLKKVSNYLNWNNYLDEAHPPDPGEMNSVMTFSATTSFELRSVPEFAKTHIIVGMDMAVLDREHCPMTKYNLSLAGGLAWLFSRVTIPTALHLQPASTAAESDNKDVTHNLRKV